MLDYFFFHFQSEFQFLDSYRSESFTVPDLFAEFVYGNRVHDPRFLQREPGTTEK